ncbi:alginate lyase family protein [Roseomonas elaeocarpi]|uniref:Alginate lyase family protein n=1 Tax=Roseomonas elaeocarpi TaxID=907779 RepID=A0ABV6JZ96_9PROT
MRLILLAGLLAGLLACLCAALPAQSRAEPARFLSYDPDALALARSRLAAGDPLYTPSRDALLRRAEAALTHPAPTVTAKTLLPASGDRHDYYSFGPYWWPDPARPGGLPYIRRDGQTNPASKTEATDSARLASFGEDVGSLGLAYALTGEARFARKAAEMIRTWFVDPDTRMNPNLAHAQAIPGIVEGRGIGIIDGRWFLDVMDAVELIRPADALTPAEYEAVRDWYRAMTRWLLSSPEGFEESNWHNNHGSWFDAQVVGFALFTGQEDVAKQQLRITALRRVAGQFDREGRQVAELERTRPWHYSQFNLQAYTRLGRYAELVDAGLANDLDHTDLWHFTLDEHGLHRGFRFLAGFVGGEARWPYRELQEGDGMDLAVGNMMAAARAWPEDAAIRGAAETLLRRYPGQVEALLWPLR